MLNATPSSPSPTLAGDGLHYSTNAEYIKLQHQIEKTAKIARMDKAGCKLMICIQQNHAGGDVVLLSDFPPEFEKAFHDYATRLIAERNILQHQLLKENGEI